MYPKILYKICDLAGGHWFGRKVTLRYKLHFHLHTYSTQVSLDSKENHGKTDPQNPVCSQNQSGIHASGGAFSEARSREKECKLFRSFSVGGYFAWFLRMFFFCSPFFCTVFSRDFQTFIETLLPHLRSSFLFGVRQLRSVFNFNYFFTFPEKKFVLAFVFFTETRKQSPLPFSQD